jgi:beta-glucosidase-like glycosyl hydrolase
MASVAELLIPAIRWDAETGYEPEREAIDRALALGVGGFLLRAAPEADARALIKDIRAKSKIPLLIGADLERGAAQQFGGTTGVPPLAAIAALNDPNLVARAAKLMAREVRPIGVNWGFAPACDLSTPPNNVVTGMSAISSNPAVVSATVSAWIEACQHEGMLACAKYFPGYGRVLGDPYAGPPVVDISRSQLFDHEFVPFRAAIGSRVASMLVAHVRYPSLDAGDSPATFSTQILRYLLREKYSFEGLVVTDVLMARGALSFEEERELSVRALDAGCDLLLAPSHLEHLVAALDESVRDGPLYDDRIDQSRRRRLKWAQWAAPQTDYRKVSGSDVAWALQLAERVVHVVRGSVAKLSAAVEVVIVDDDDGMAPSPLHPRTLLLDALGAAEVTARRVGVPSSASRAPVLVAVFGEMRGRRDGFAFTADTQAKVRHVCAMASEQERDAVVILFTPPQLAECLETAEVVVCAWSGDRCMQEAAVRWLIARA